MLLFAPMTRLRSLFEFFVNIFDDLVQGARKDGQFDSGIVDIRANSIELQEEPKVCTYLILSPYYIFQ